MKASLAALVALAALAGCGAPDAPSAAGEGPGRVEGTVFYRERMLLPPGARVQVQLQDISRPDAMAAVLAETQFVPEGGPPWPFAIDYDRGSIDARLRYSLRATVSLDGRLMFTTTEFIDPFAAGPLDVLVQRVPEPVRHSPGQEGSPPAP